MKTPTGFWDTARIDVPWPGPGWVRDFVPNAIYAWNWPAHELPEFTAALCRQT